MAKLKYRDPEDLEFKPIPAISVTGDKNFVYTQSIPASVWDIYHGLNKYPSVTVIDSGGTEVYGEVSHVDEKHLTISFQGEFSGIATLN